MTQLSMDDLMFKPGLMKGERILITGGGTGLGKVMAEACLMLGADVYIWGRRGGVVEDAAKALMDAHGGKCVGRACDIRVPEAIHDAMDQVWAGGAPTGLVNNAAGNFISRTEDLSPRGFDAIARSSAPNCETALAAIQVPRVAPLPWSQEMIQAGPHCGRTEDRTRGLTDAA